MRSVRRVHRNVAKKIYAPLDALGVNYTVFVHTFRLRGLYSSARNHEAPVRVDHKNLRLLRPHVYAVDDQDAFDKTYDVLDYGARGDPFHNDFVSVRNEVRYLYSQYRLVQLMAAHPRRDLYILLRPDVRFIHAITGELLRSWLALNASTVATPDFACPRGKVNDRAAVGRWPAIRVYGSRYAAALGYSKDKRLHAETFLHDYLVARNVSWSEAHFRFQRVRTDGSVPALDLDLADPRYDGTLG